MKEKTSSKKKPMMVFVLFIAVVLIIIGAVVLLVTNNRDDNNDNEVVDENIPETEHQTLEDAINWDEEDAATGFYIDTERDDIYIGSVNLDSNVAEGIVVITFNVTATSNITTPLTGTFVFRNDADEELDALTFEIPVLSVDESAPIEIVSNNLGTILTTSLSLIIE